MKVDVLGRTTACHEIPFKPITLMENDRQKKAQVQIRTVPKVQGTPARDQTSLSTLAHKDSLLYTKTLIKMSVEAEI